MTDIIQWQVRHGTKAELDAITLAVGELGVTTDTGAKHLYIGTGSTPLLAGRILYGSGAPSDPGVAGTLYIDTATKKQYYSNGTNYIELGTTSGSIAAITSGTITGITDLVVEDGGTGVSTLTDHGVLLGSGTGAITPLGVAANGQLVVGSTGADPVIASLTGSEGITVTEGAGTLAIKVTDDGITLAKQASGASRGIMHYAGATFDPTLLAAPATGKVLTGNGTTADITWADPAPTWGQVSGKPTTFAPVIGSGAGDAVAGNDSRLTNARDPNAHNQNVSTIAAGTAGAGDFIFSRVLSYGAGLVTSNVAIGGAALNANTTGASNTAVGTSALAANTVGAYNTACGMNALLTNLTGTSNTALGYDTLRANTTGASNTALGYSSLSTNITGSDNVAVGQFALRLNTGDANTAVGVRALDANSTGTNNSAFGRYALIANTTGVNNTAVGASALAANTVATGNTAVGFSALTTTTTGDLNTAVGSTSLFSNQTGVRNTAVGHTALYACVGSFNTALGQDTLNSVTSGSNLTAIGYDADASSATATNEVTLGNASVATLRCQVTSITAISDERDKTNIGNIPVGLEFINRLKPREFTWNMRDGSKVGIQEMGFIAQELDQAQKEEGVTIPGLVFKANPDRLEAAPGYLLPILVKAIQELSARVKELEAR